MKKMMLASIALIALAGTARAADIAPSVAAPAYKTPVIALYNWTGFYIGANLGYGWGRLNTDVNVGTVAGTANGELDGVLGGFQAGYNWQMGRFVFGFETDLQLSDQKNSTSFTCPAATCGVTVTATGEPRLPWFGTARLRLGYAADRWLVYATGGLAYGELRTDVTVTAAGIGTATGSASTTRAALAVGGGVEYGITNNWSAKLEYLFINSGDVNNTTTLAGVGTVTHTDRIKDHVLRAGVNYRF
jgi:outer membrane immunogenic protein